MGETVAHVAVSLDGYIAEADGGVGFLERFGDEGFDGFDFKSFQESIGALVTGSASYEQAVGFGWLWHDKPTLVLTSRTDLPVPEGADVRFANESTPSAIRHFAAETSGRLWVFGGGQVITEGLLGGAIDVLDLMIIPEVVGLGVPLFTQAVSRPMTVREATPFPNGAVRIIYSCK